MAVKADNAWVSAGVSDDIHYTDILVCGGGGGDGGC